MPQKVDKVMAQDTLLPQTEESLPPSFNNNEFPTTKLCLEKEQMVIRRLLLLPRL